MLAAMEGSILELLAGHESLGYEQIAAQLGARPDDVRSALADLGTAASSMSSGSETCRGRLQKQPRTGA